VKPSVVHQLFDLIITPKHSSSRARDDGNQRSRGRESSARRLFRSVLGERIEPT